MPLTSNRWLVRGSRPGASEGCLPLAVRASVMYIGPWQEYKLGKLIAEHTRLLKDAILEQERARAEGLATKTDYTRLKLPPIGDVDLTNGVSGLVPGLTRSSSKMSVDSDISTRSAPANENTQNHRHRPPRGVELSKTGTVRTRRRSVGSDPRRRRRMGAGARKREEKKKAVQAHRSHISQMRKLYGIDKSKDAAASQANQSSDSIVTSEAQEQLSHSTDHTRARNRKPTPLNINSGHTGSRSSSSSGTHGAQQTPTNRGYGNYNTNKTSPGQAGYDPGHSRAYSKDSVGTPGSDISSRHGRHGSHYRHPLTPLRQRTPSNQGSSRAGTPSTPGVDWEDEVDDLVKWAGTIGETNTSGDDDWMNV